MRPADGRRAVGAGLSEARRSLWRRRRRSVLSATGIALAAAMLAAAIVVADGLGAGFDRAARASGLPDIVVRFDPQAARRVGARIRALPNVVGFSLRLELTNIPIAAGARRRGDAVAEVLGGGRRRGYAVTSGRDLRSVGPEVLLEQAFAQAWQVRVGSEFLVRGLGEQRVVGYAQAPDNVGFPLAKPRFYLSRSAIDARFGAELDPQVNLAEVWLRDPRYENEVLVQARASSFGLHNLRFATRSGLRVLLDQAAGIVIDLLVALSAIALLTAGAMLAASSRAEVQRRLAAIGVRRAIGASPGQVVLTQVFETGLVAAPAATLGLVAGLVATLGPTGRLLSLLNEPPPGRALILPLAGGWLLGVLIPVAGAAWPALAAARTPVVTLLRGADVTGGSRARRPRARPRSAGRGSLNRLGARLVAARRARLLATVTTLGLSTGFVLLMLALASALSALETDPGALGKRYALSAALPPAAVPAVRRIPGVQAAAPRYELQAADSFALGETIDVIAYPGDHTSFEAPQLISGRRLRGPREAEVGDGLAQALGVGPGQTLALALPGGTELRLRVAGVVSSLDHDGRVAYVPAAALLASDPAAPSQIAIRLRSLGDAGRVTLAVQALGAPPTPASGATARGAPLVAVLRAILRAVAIVDGLVCLYALIQACALTVQERRRTIAVLRACGGAQGAVRRVLAGAALAIVVPSGIIGIALEQLVFGPALTRLAAGYAILPLAATPAEVGATVAGLVLVAGLAVLWVARQATREPVLSGLAG